MKHLFYNKNTTICICGLAAYFLLVSHSSLLANDNDNYSIFSIKCQTFSEENRKKILELEKNQNSLQQSSREKMQAFAISPKQQFRVHYDTTGLNAVDKTDKDKNGIPDYIDSVCAIFDYVYVVQVEEMGMLRPRTDYYSDDDFEFGDLLYDVYVKELGDGSLIYSSPTYGYTSPIGFYTSGNGYFSKNFSTISIDNNYSPTDMTPDGRKRSYATTGIEGLKVTAAHEYHHAVQFAYGNDINGSSIYEMSAVCLEILTYPELNDYLQYVNLIMDTVNRFSFGNKNAINGYSYGIFFFMMTQKYGVESIKKYWELVEQGNSCYKAFDSFFVERNSSLAEEWLDFINWIYYSGERAVAGKYFPMANKFRTMSPTNVFPNPTTFGFDITPYELRFVRFGNVSRNNFILSDTLDIVFTNLNTPEVIAQNQSSSILCTAATSNYYLSDGEEVFNNYWYKISSNSEFMGSQIYIRAGGPVTSTASVYPQPFDKSKDKYICFPISDDIIIGEDWINLNIFDANLKTIFSSLVATTSDNEKRVVKYNASELEQGIYIFTTGRANVDIIGKFVVK